MGCIEKIYSVSAVVGTGKCNANCSFCAGKCMRETARMNVGSQQALYARNLEAAIKLSARYGGWSLSLTSSGEPTCEPLHVSGALQIYKNCADQGAYFPNVNLFTNGILFGNEEFCDTWLPTWRRLGLTNIAISVHSTNLKLQADAYNLPDVDSYDNRYPRFETIRKNIESNGIGVRATLLLQKGLVDCTTLYVEAIQHLVNMGYNNITSWPVGNPDGTRNEYTPNRLALWGIRRWLNKNAKLCHGHSWGGGVWDYNGNILRLTDYVTKHDPKKDYVRQLVVWPDAKVTYSWIKEGALCLM